MVSFPCVHHIEVGVVDGPGAVDILKSRYTFKLTATRKTEVAEQWLLVKNNTRFLITSLKKIDETAIKNDSFLQNWASDPDPCTSQKPKLPSKDSVFNVAFQVKDLNQCVKRLHQQGVVFSKTLHTVPDSHGTLRTCTIKSCVGDIYHTLLEKQDYPGYFLPGFTPVDDLLHSYVDDNSIEASYDDSNKKAGCDVSNKKAGNDGILDSMLASFDHVALAVEMNTAMSVIGWYERCFGMKRFLINKEESPDNGLVLSTDNVGLRLRAMEYWKCAEVGLITPTEDGVTSRLSMVVAEGLPPAPGSSEDNQIESWMRQHGGPGIQHVAITSKNIKMTVRNLKLSGAAFANAPPDAYYSKIGRLDDIIRAGEDVDALKENGILIDTEADGIHEVTHCPQDDNRTESYLLQIFTKPVFRKDPFFLEIIQREGATGFGSGNVAALYRSVQAYIVGEKNSTRD